MTVIVFYNQWAMLEFDLLRAFVAVAECGGFRRAAERLHLTQSTVSQQIKRLELETGRSLFRRNTRAVALTDDGEMLLGDARRLLQLEEAARHRLTAPRLSGVVRLGAVEEVAGGSLPPALGRFARLHPNVRLEVLVGVSAELIEQLDAGGLDVVLAKRPWGTARGRFVWREPLVWAAAETFDLAPGAILPLALFREHSVSREAALDAFRNSERPWHIVYTSPSLTGVRAAALAGLAVTPLPASAVGPGLRILGELEGLPPLPDLEFAIFEKPQPGPATVALSAALTLLAPASDRPQASISLASAPDGERTGK
jgi:DNA-binding transcriptional LysR family regulator